MHSYLDDGSRILHTKPTPTSQTDAACLMRSLRAHASWLGIGQGWLRSILVVLPVVMQADRLDTLGDPAIDLHCDLSGVVRTTSSHATPCSCFKNTATATPWACGSILRI
jgi:hypothetical protein